MVQSRTSTQFSEGLHLHIQETSERFRNLTLIKPQLGSPRMPPSAIVRLKMGVMMGRGHNLVGAKECYAYSGIDLAYENLEISYKTYQRESW